MSELKFFESENYKFLYQWNGNFLTEHYNDLNMIANNLYYKLCRDFGIENPRELRVHLMRMRPDATISVAGVTSYRYEIEGKPIILIGVSIGVLYYFADVAYQKILPHEVAHAAAFLFDRNESLENEGHGKLWVEFMKYLKLPPDVRSGLHDHISQIESCQEL